MEIQEVIESIKTEARTATENKENPIPIVDAIVTINSYLAFVGEQYTEARELWAKEFVRAKQTKNPQSGKFYTDKESECVANIKVPSKDKLKTYLDIYGEFIKTAKVKIGVLQWSQNNEPKIDSIPNNSIVRVNLKKLDSWSYKKRMKFYKFCRENNIKLIPKH